MKLFTSLAAAAATSSLAAAQLQAPTPDTSEWNFTGVTGDVVDKAYGPGELLVADGAAGQTLMLDSFTTTSAAGIPGIGGVDASVLQFDRHEPNTTGYTFRPFVTNGNGGVGMRSFTLVYDIYLDANNSDSYQGLLQTNDTNSNDAELHLEIFSGGFWNDQNASAGGGSIGAGTWLLGEWNRFVYVNDYDGNFSAMYVNGAPAFTDLSYTYCYNGDQGFKNWILSDQNGDVTNGWIANFAVVDRMLTAQEAAQLGGANADGVFGTSIGTNYCVAVPNSTGVAASISASGSAVVTDNDMTLTATALPTGSFGFFLVSDLQGLVANPGGSAGNLCLAGAIGRYVGPGQIQNSGPAGEFSLSIDLNALPRPTGLVPVSAGETWNFTSWYRDAVGGQTTSNFTDGLEVTFL